MLLVQLDLPLILVHLSALLNRSHPPSLVEELPLDKSLILLVVQIISSHAPIIGVKPSA